MRSIRETERQALSRAFKTLRKHGFVARQNFSCCGGCASCEIAENVSEMPEKRRGKVRGAVFFTRQDWSRLFEGPSWINDPKVLWVAYGQVDTQAHGPIGLSTEEVGLALGMALQAEGLNVEWTGDANERVKVIFS